MHLHGLRNVVVHAGGEAKFTVALHRIRGERDDLGLAVDGEAGADLAAGFESVHLGHLEIHEHEIVGAAFEGGEDFEAVGDGVGVVAEALEEAEGDLLVHGVVLGEKDVERELLADGPFGGLHAEDGGGHGGIEEGTDRLDEGGGAEGFRGAGEELAVAGGGGRGLAERIHDEAGALERAEFFERGRPLGVAAVDEQEGRGAAEGGGGGEGGGGIGHDATGGAPFFEEGAEAGLGDGVILDAEDGAVAEGRRQGG